METGQIPPTSSARLVAGLTGTQCSSIIIVPAAIHSRVGSEFRTAVPALHGR